LAHHTKIVAVVVAAAILAFVLKCAGPALRRAVQALRRWSWSIRGWGRGSVSTVGGRRNRPRQCRLDRKRCANRAVIGFGAPTLTAFGEASEAPLVGP